MSPPPPNLGPDCETSVSHAAPDRENAQVAQNAKNTPGKSLYVRWKSAATPQNQSVPRPTGVKYKTTHNGQAGCGSQLVPPTSDCEATFQYMHVSLLVNWSESCRKRRNCQQSTTGSSCLGKSGLSSKHRFTPTRQTTSSFSCDTAMYLSMKLRSMYVQSARFPSPSESDSSAAQSTDAKSRHWSGPLLIGPHCEHRLHYLHKKVFWCFRSNSSQ